MRKVLFIMENLGGGGAERILIDLLKRFDYKKFHVSLLLIYKTGIYVDAVPDNVELQWVYTKESTHYHKFPFKHMLWLKRWRLAKRMRQLLQGEHYDTIVSFCEGWPLLAHCAVIDHADLNVSWIHTNLQRYHWTRRVFSRNLTEKDAYGLMDRVAVVSEGARQGFEELFGKLESLRVIYNIIDRERIVCQAEEYKVGRSSERNVLVTVGTLKQVKRQERLIAMIKCLADRGYDTELRIVGKGKLLKRLTAEAEKLQVADKVVFTGFHSNPHPYIKTADVFVLSSDTEGLSTAICEAMCLGKPIVATDVTGVNELLSDESGLLSDTDPMALADKVAYLIDNPEQAKRIGQKALEKSYTFDADEVIRKVYNIIS